MSISENVKSIKDGIKSIASHEVMLLAATKTRDVNEINEAIKAGIDNVGENRVNELLEKYEGIDKSAQMHFIGVLQTNKIRKIIDKVYLIHSIDSYKCLDAVNRIAAELGIKTNILIQVNKGEEESKSGFFYNEVKDVVSYAVENLDNINILGLMAVVPNTSDVQNLKKHFCEMSELFNELKNTYPLFKYLSMGMSNDYKIAIECGSNIVRIGTKIFGERIYTN